MKYYIITSLFLLLLNGCSYKNAYTSFDMNKTQQLIESNTQSSRVASDNGVYAIFSAIYLNNIYKRKGLKDESFVISLYMKDITKKHEFKLNNKKIIDIIPLDKNNRYFPLVKNQESWNINYIIKFKKSVKDLNLTLSIDNLSSYPLIFFKE